MEKQKYQSPTFFGVVYASRLFREVVTKDDLGNFRRDTKPAIDLENEKHAEALLLWLNKWGCRITKDQFPVLRQKLADWSHKWKRRLPRIDLQSLQARQLDALAGAYGELIAIPEFGPTAASKALFALCPYAAMPWDAAIQAGFGLLGREPEKYREMLVLSGSEANTVMADAARHGVGDPQALLSRAESRAITLPELLDRYHWVTITRRHKIPTREELVQWVQWSGTVSQ